jgi:hypothetical protein
VQSVLLFPLSASWKIDEQKPALETNYSSARLLTGIHWIHANYDYT